MTLVYSHNPRSAGARALARGLGGKMIRHHNSRFRGGEWKTVVNWGAANIPNREVLRSRILNQPYLVGTMSNKLAFFSCMELIDAAREACVRWTDKRVDAVNWCRRGHKVVCRTVLSGHSGVGIVIARTEDELVDASLYTLNVPKKEEYRLHYGNRGVLFDVQRKARRLDCPNPNWLVRNHANGFIFARSNMRAPTCVSRVATEVFVNSNLDFGAVDVIYNESQDRAYVLEINTAPGLVGTTLANYIEMFKGDDA